MILTDEERERAAEIVERRQEWLQSQAQDLAAKGFSVEEIDRAIGPQACIHEEMREEIDAYDRLKQASLDDLRDYQDVGSMLAAARISRGVTQAQLGERIGMSVDEIYRQERSQWPGVTVDFASQILAALGARLAVAAAPMTPGSDTLRAASSSSAAAS